MFLEQGPAGPLYIANNGLAAHCNAYHNGPLAHCICNLNGPLAHYNCKGNCFAIANRKACGLSFSGLRPGFTLSLGLGPVGPWGPD